METWYSCNNERIAKMKILITGFGFIGSHLVQRLVSLKHQVIVFDRYMPRHNWNKISEPYGFFMGDIRDKNAVSEAVGVCDAAINLAGILGTSETVDNPFPSVETNIMGALNFLEACRRQNKPGVQITVGNHFMNNSYAISKTTAERFALMYNKEHGTKVAVVRGLNAYGERQKHKPVRKIMPNFITRALRGEPIRIFGNGESVMDMIYVKDLANVLAMALLSPNVQYDKIYEAGTGVLTTVNQIAETVNRVVGNAPGNIEHVPMRAGEVEDSVVVGNPSTLSDLGINRGDLRTLEAGVGMTVEWYRKNYPWQND